MATRIPLFILATLLLVNGVLSLSFASVAIGAISLIAAVVLHPAPSQRLSPSAG